MDVGGPYNRPVFAPYAHPPAFLTGSHQLSACGIIYLNRATQIDLHVQPSRRQNPLAGMWHRSLKIIEVVDVLVKRRGWDMTDIRIGHTLNPFLSCAILQTF